MIVDWNRTTLERGQVFHFANSLRPFVEICTTNFTTLFLDIDEMVAYNFDELEYQDLKFYRKENDDDFLGIDVDGRLEWVG